MLNDIEKHSLIKWRDSDILCVGINDGSEHVLPWKRAVFLKKNSMGNI